MTPLSKGEFIRYFFGMESPTRRWIFDCGHSVVCECIHMVGMRVYCTTCNQWTEMRKWERWSPPATQQEDSP